MIIFLSPVSTETSTQVEVPCSTQRTCSEDLRKEGGRGDNRPILTGTRVIYMNLHKMQNPGC